MRNVEVRRQLRLPVSEALLERLRKAKTDPAYDIVSWTGPCPARFADQYARLRGRLMAEAPTGSLAYEAERWGVRRLREEEARNDRQGRTLSTVVAVAPDGSLAGHTVMALPASGGRAYQEDTLVLPEHRGHRLGLALKATNLRRVRGRPPWHLQGRDNQRPAERPHGEHQRRARLPALGTLPGMAAPRVTPARLGVVATAPARSAAESPGNGSSARSRVGGAVAVRRTSRDP